MKTTTYLSSSAFLLGICALGNALIAMGTTRWSHNLVSQSESGLFETCLGRRINCLITINGDPAFVKATASFMVMGAALVFSALICSLLAIFKYKSQKIGAALYLIGGVFFLIGAAVYTGVVRDARDASVSLGFSVWLAWSSVAIALLSGIIQASAAPKSEE